MFSIVRYRKRERLDVHRGDWRGLTTDGLEDCRCVKVVDTDDLNEAKKVLQAMRLGDNSDASE